MMAFKRLVSITRGVNVDIRGLSLETGRRLVDHDFRVRQRVALADPPASTAPIEAAKPTQMVLTLHLANCMVS